MWGLQGEGCSINLAAGSMLAEAIQGKALNDVDALVGPVSQDDAG